MKIIAYLKKFQKKKKLIKKRNFSSQRTHGFKIFSVNFQQTKKKKEKTTLDTVQWDSLRFEKYYFLTIWTFVFTKRFSILPYSLKNSLVKQFFLSKCEFRIQNS